MISPRPPERIDRNLERTLRAEWPGILRWAVEGCLAWQREGLVVPEAVAAATLEYQQDQDNVGRWLAERCELGPVSWHWEMANVVLSYEAWCATEEETPLTAKVLGKRLKALGVGDVKSNGKRYRTGIRGI